jgi:hypothetical protein
MVKGMTRSCYIIDSNLNIFFWKAWDATESKINEVEYQLRNLNSNGVHSAGTTLTSVGFNAFFSSSTTPIITSVLFNGDNVCLIGKLLNY